jgi:DNA repair exonuclease SbcCD ATPase subunit
MSIRQDFIPIIEKLDLPIPDATLLSIDKCLKITPQAQIDFVSSLENEVSQLATLKERYEHASVTGWVTINERKEKSGDPEELPSLIDEILQDLLPVAKILDLPPPKPTIPNLESTLAAARRAQVTTSSSLEKKAGQLDTLKERYEQISKEVVEGISVPIVLTQKNDQLRNQIRALNKEIADASLQNRERQSIEQDLEDLHSQVLALPNLQADLEKRRIGLATLDVEAKKATLYNQVITVGFDYLEQAHPEHCPLCKQRIIELKGLLEILHQETPTDIEKLKKERNRIEKELNEKKEQISTIEQKKIRIKEMEVSLMKLPTNLEISIQEMRNELATQTDELIAIEAEITQIEARIKLASEHRQRLASVEKEIQTSLGQYHADEDVIGSLDHASNYARNQAAEIQALDFQPLADKLNQANQIKQIQEDEEKLQKRLDTVLIEVNQALEVPHGEDIIGAIEQRIESVRNLATEIRDLDYQPIAEQLDEAKQIDEIKKDESRLKEFQVSYQIANREKAKLNHRILRLIELRNALQDIAETSKRQQKTIVTGLLDALEINQYYRQLDPHPAYSQLQIEPELTTKGTFNYWIKALSEDRAHGTYVQTRFSTAQSNCAAIAIFLAVNQHLSKKLETVILDDPSQSMDPERMRRLAHTLASIPRQVIIATEDPKMFELLVGAFDKPTIHQLETWTIEGSSLINS